MKKRQIYTAQDVERLSSQGFTQIQIDEYDMVTAMARETANQLGVTLSFSSEGTPKAKIKEIPSPGEKDDPKAIEQRLFEETAKRVRNAPSPSVERNLEMIPPEDKVIITVAPTGVITREMNPNVPEQPDEIAEAAYACYNEGAAICHIHARDKEGKPTGNREVFKEIHEKIRDRCSIIIQDGTGISPGDPNLTREQRIECVDANPDMATINMGSLMRVSGPYKGLPFVNLREDIEYYASRIRGKGIKIEMEVYSDVMLREVENLIEKGLVKKPYYINLVMGMRDQGAVPATVQHLFSLLSFVPDGSMVQVKAEGFASLPLTTLGMILTGCIRIGIEDSIYYKKEELVKSNAQLIARAARIARELNKEPASPEETRQILRI